MLSGTIGLCTTTQTVGVTVYSVALVQAAVSTPSVCFGNTLTLSATGAANYTWNPGPLNGSNIAIAPAASAIYTVTGDNQNGCINTATVSITVYPLPTATLSGAPASLCSGQSQIRGASGAQGYTWNPGGSTANAITASPTVTTVYSLMAVNFFGCTTTQTAQVSITTTPTLSLAGNATSLCAGSSVSLSASGAPAFTWQPVSLSGSLVTVSPAVNIVYTITGANGNCTDTKTLSVSVNAVPVLSLTASAFSLCSGSSLTLQVQGVPIIFGVQLRLQETLSALLR